MDFSQSSAGIAAMIKTANLHKLYEDDICACPLLFLPATPAQSR